MHQTGSEDNRTQSVLRNRSKVLLMKTLLAIVGTGYGMANKLRLLQIYVLQYTPNLFKSIFKLDGLAEKLWKSVIVEKSGIKYALVDQESYGIIGEFETFMQLWFEPQKNDVIIDVGAHIGKYTIPSARIAGTEGLVIALEPNPLNFQVLRKNACLNRLKNVILLNIAAWNTNSTLKLFTGHFGGHHSSKMNWKLGYFMVNAKRLDCVLRVFGVKRVDWIKIDVEGAEWEVFQGMEEILGEFRPKIIVEVADENVEKVKDFMATYGYGVVRISPIYEFSMFEVFRKFTHFIFLPLRKNRPANYENCTSE